MGKRLEYTVEAVNRRLREAKSKARVYQRGETLWLQATLPPKPGNPHSKPYQQRISLGVPAREDGFLSGAENSRAVWLGESDYLGELNPTV